MTDDVKIKLKADLNLLGVGDFIQGAPESWEEDYKRIWAELQACQHNKTQHRVALESRDAEIAALRERVGELEEQLPWMWMPDKKYYECTQCHAKIAPPGPLEHDEGCPVMANK